jgi:hypothetical protein
MIQAHKNGRRSNRLSHVPFHFIVLSSPACDRFPNFALMLRQLILQAGPDFVTQLLTEQPEHIAHSGCLVIFMDLLV